jgi:hypothetical protein
MHDEHVSLFSSRQRWFSRQAPFFFGFEIKIDSTTLNLADAANYITLEDLTEDNDIQFNIHLA